MHIKEETKANWLEFTMEDQQATTEPSQQFENIDFNSSPDENNKESSNNEDNEQVQFLFLHILDS